MKGRAPGPNLPRLSPWGTAQESITSDLKQSILMIYTFSKPQQGGQTTEGPARTAPCPLRTRTPSLAGRRIQPEGPGAPARQPSAPPRPWAARAARASRGRGRATCAGAPRVPGSRQPTARAGERLGPYHPPRPAGEPPRTAAARRPPAPPGRWRPRPEADVRKGTRRPRPRGAARRWAWRPAHTSRPLAAAE